MTDEPTDPMKDASAVLGAVFVLLDRVDWDWLHGEVERADTLGPILDPTAYRDSLDSGTLDRNKRVVAATRRYLAELRAIHGWAAAVRAYRCPCLVCPECGYFDDDLDKNHPADGLSGPCRRCRNYEWWAHAGPHMDGRHIMSSAEEAEWRAHDFAVLHGDVP